MILRGISCLAAFLWTTMLVAQAPVFSTKETENCLQQAIGPVEREACIGASSSACLADGGGSYVESFCYSEEADYWDERLNASYQTALRGARNDNPVLADALRDLQRAWIVYRDARCQAIFDAWGEGTGRSPAFAYCHMRTTAEQTLFLEGGL